MDDWIPSLITSLKPTATLGLGWLLHWEVSMLLDWDSSVYNPKSLKRPPPAYFSFVWVLIFGGFLLLPPFYWVWSAIGLAVSLIIIGIAGIRVACGRDQ